MLNNRKFGFPYSLIPRFPPLHSGAAFSTPVISTPAFLLLPHFPLPRFQSPPFCGLFCGPQICQKCIGGRDSAQDPTGWDHDAQTSNRLGRRTPRPHSPHPRRFDYPAFNTSILVNPLPPRRSLVTLLLRAGYGPGSRWHLNTGNKEKMNEVFLVAHYGVDPNMHWSVQQFWNSTDQTLPDKCHHYSSGTNHKCLPPTQRIVCCNERRHCISSSSCCSKCHFCGCVDSFLILAGGQPTKSHKVWTSLVDLHKVHAALIWLPDHN